MTSVEILIAEPDSFEGQALKEACQKEGWSSFQVQTGTAAIEALETGRFSVALVSLELSDVSGFQVLEWLKSFSKPLDVIILSRDSESASIVKALKLGATDYLTKPLESFEKVVLSVRRALETRTLLHKLESFDDVGGSLDSLVGKSPQMRAVYDMIRQISTSNSNVLIMGESGTGKELVAKAIHQSSKRREKPFVVINCAAMPETLFESELFGYAKGAFTGAAHDKPGLFEMAHQGTIFLDEIGEIPLGTQVKLLRVLQEGETKRLGDNHLRHVDVRILAATHKDLQALIAKGLFREDLYYRLNVINLFLSPLRERLEDIQLLTNHFLVRFAQKMNRAVPHVRMDAVEVLNNYSWPGNVRELENVLERAVVLAESDTITARNLPSHLLGDTFYKVPAPAQESQDVRYKEAKKRALNLFNQSYIMSTLEKSAGNITAAAELAGMDRSNFKKILKKYFPQYKETGRHKTKES